MLSLRPRLRDLLTGLYLRSALARRLHLAWTAATAPARTFDLGHLARFKEADALGPVQREEALLLFALVRVLRPRTVVEVGFHRGHSALNFLLALGEPPAGGTLYSYDIAPSAAEIAVLFDRRFRNFRFHGKDQRALAPDDVDGRPVDLAFLDASHDFDANRETFERLAPLMPPGAVLAVHDTGTWHRDHMTAEHLAWAAASNGQWLDPDELAPWPEERRFVHWVVTQHSEWSALHLHSRATLRHGLTLLQKAPAPPIGAAAAIGPDVP